MHATVQRPGEKRGKAGACAATTLSPSFTRVRTVPFARLAGPGFKRNATQRRPIDQTEPCKGQLIEIDDDPQSQSDADQEAYVWAAGRRPYVSPL
jgi:hypothetical protein